MNSLSSLDFNFLPKNKDPAIKAKELFFAKLNKSSPSIFTCPSSSLDIVVAISACFLFSISIGILL